MHSVVFALTLLSLAAAFRPVPTFRDLANRYKHAVTPSCNLNHLRNCKTLLAARASQNIHDEDNEDEDEEISLEVAFNELSGGKKSCSFDSILKWDIVAELVDEELITVDELKELFVEAGGKSKNNALSCDIEAFEKFLDLLEPYADGDDDFDSEEDVSSNHKVEDDEDDEGFDEEEGELVEDVFARLSNGGKYVLPKDITSWDVIQDLIEEGATTEKEIKDKVVKIGGKKGLDFEQFSAFVDELVESFNEVDVKYDDEEDDEDVVEVDPDLVFEELSKGRETISLKDLLQWDLIQTMIDEGQLDKNEIMDVISTVGVADINNITVTDFEAILDELSFRAESGLEEGEDLDDATDYTSIKK